MNFRILLLILLIFSLIGCNQYNQNEKNIQKKDETNIKKDDETNIKKNNKVKIEKKIESRDLQKYNPYTSEMIDRLIGKINEVHRQIAEDAD